MMLISFLLTFWSHIGSSFVEYLRSTWGAPAKKHKQSHMLGYLEKGWRSKGSIP